MEPEGSLPYWQVSATFPYPEPTLSSPRHPLHYIILVSELNKLEFFSTDFLKIIQYHMQWKPVHW
jgi:hypothetical protein